MGLQKYSISNEILKDHYYYEEDVSTKHGVFRLNIFDKKTKRLVGTVEGTTGTWRVIGDAHYEAFHLLEAIRVAVSNYISYRKEFEGLVATLNLTVGEKNSKTLLSE